MISRFPFIFVLGVVCLSGLLGSGQVVFAQAPVLEVRLGEDGARVGAAYDVTYEVRWEGAADEFAVVPGEMGVVPWADARMVRTSTRVEDGAFVVAQTVEYVAHKAGEFEVPSFVVGYFDPALATEPEEGEEASLPEQSYLRSASFSLTVRRGSGRFVFYGVATALIAGLCALGFLRGRRQGQPALASGSVSTPTPVTVPAAINLARQHRLDGQFYGFYKELARGASMLPASAETRQLCERLERVADDVGYKGARPSDDEMDGALKDLERALQQSPVG